MKKLVVYIIIVIFSSLLIFSCQKSVEEKIDGTWRMINMGNLTADQFVEWDFMGGYFYMLQTQAGNPNFDTISAGNYQIKIKRLTRYITLSESSNINWNGTFKITKLNSKYLVLVRDQEYLEMYEFVKK